MIKEHATRFRDAIERIFPERHLYLRSNGEIRGYVLTTGRQVILAGAGAILGGWLFLSTSGFALNSMAESRAEARVAQARAASERINADLQARLESAVVRMSATTGSLEETAQMVERRHAALTQVMGMFTGIAGAEEALAPARPLDPETNSPIRRIASIQLDQERLISRAENFADSRAERLRLAFRLAGLNPSAYSGAGVPLGGPLVEARDPRALAAVLDVDESFAVRIRHAADNLTNMRQLANAAETLPFYRPVGAARTTSGFGVRFDPFNGRPALHQGQDFAAPANSAILATAPGVVSFAGVRGGYGRTVEVDHGGGFKTRYAHMNSIAVATGQRVAVGQRLGGMGSTGRSTGVHLHYEVWMNGRPQNPARFMRAGEQIVQQN